MRPGQPDPRLVLRATPPRIQKTVLGLPRLASGSAELADKSIIVVQAPAGFGKTSLLAQWRREALQRGAIVAWLTLDEGNDPARFAAGLAQAMRMGSGRSSFAPEIAGNAGPDGTALDGLTDWLAAVASIAVEVVLILDDAHLLPPATLADSLTYLLHNAPANLKVMVASRGPVNLPVSDWIAQGRFACVGTDELRLRLQETVAVLAARFGSRIDADACARLHDLTEGWPLGLQLALATIEKSPNLREAIEAISARSGDIQRYFVECLINRLTPALSGFLVRISFVDALHPELCEALLPGEEGAGMLARLREATPIFAQAVDSDWQRIHPLAREFLVPRFEALPLEERRELQARAGRWLAERQMHEEAARHCLEAGQVDHAYALVERGLYDILISGQVSRVLEWIDRLPAAELQRRPRLRLTAGWTLALSERHAEAARLVGPLMDDGAGAPEQRCESAVICAAAAYFADDLAGTERFISPWLDSMDNCQPLLRAIIRNHVAALTLYRGGPEQARLYYRQRSAVVENSDFGYVPGWRDWQIGFSYLWEGQVVLGEESLRVSLARAEEHSGRRSPIAVMLASALAAVLWERDRIDEAESVLANRLDVLERRAAPDALIMGVVTAARLAAASGLERRAYDLLDSLHALGEASGLPRLRIASLAEQIRMHALRAREEACSALIARIEAICLDGARQRWGVLGSLVDMQLAMARAYAAVACNDWQRVLQQTDEAARLADGLRRGRDRIQIRLLRALALRRCGEDGDGLLGEGISLAESLGLDRILADTHPDLADWARRMRGAHRTPEFSPAPRAPASPVRETVQARVSPSALLTPKERDVLQLLAGNMSNKQIALAMGVGDETVKWHLKNLFGKLNAGTRKHALDRARMLGILDFVN